MKVYTNVMTSEVIVKIQAITINHFDLEPSEELDRFVDKIYKDINKPLNNFINGGVFTYINRNKVVTKYHVKVQNVMSSLLQSRHKDSILNMLKYLIKEYLKVSYLPAKDNFNISFKKDKTTLYNTLTGRLHIVLIDKAAIEHTTLFDQMETIKEASDNGRQFAARVVSLFIRLMESANVIVRSYNYNDTIKKATVTYNMNQDLLVFISNNLLIIKALTKDHIKGFTNKPNKVKNTYKSLRRDLYTGHYYKFTPIQSKHFIKLINTLNQQQYSLVGSIWNNKDTMKAVVNEITQANKVKSISELMTIANIQDSINKEIQHIKELSNNNSLFINWAYGPDNGRIYCKSGNFGFQKGWINYLFEFSNKQVVNDKGMKYLKATLDSLEKEVKKDPSIRNTIKYLAVKDGYDKALKGEPTGVMIEIDQKASGSQMQALSLRSKAVMEFTGALLDAFSDNYSKANAKDLYRFMIKGLVVFVNGEELDLSNVPDVRTLVKKAYNPFQYGSGKKAMANDVREELINQGYSFSEEDEVTIDYDAWINRLAEIDPMLVEFRTELLNLCSLLSKQSNTKFIEFTAPDGFNCCITSLSKQSINVIDKELIDTSVELHIKEVDPKHIGVRLVGAYSHHLDATVLRSTLRLAFSEGIEVVPVHDAFLLHPNDVEIFMKLYYKVETKLIKENILNSFFKQILTKYSNLNEQIIDNIANRFVNNIDDNFEIKGGLFLD